jgi:FKBP-type peptidyl-prolyl cis-trans isomerase
MNTGAKYKFYIPSSLAYGSLGQGNRPPNTPLVFEVELIEILD